MRGVSRDAASTDRGVSITLNYILALGISALLVTGLLVAGGNFVQDQRERVIEGEMTIIGQHLASNMESVDRYANASDDELDAAYINQTFQSSVTGSSYSIQLEEDPDQLVLQSNSPSVTVRINTTVQSDLDTDSFANGGSISVQYDPDSEQLVIRNA